MGKIFTWQEIELGKVPTLEAFRLVANRVRQTFEVGAGVEGALFFGSFATGCFNRRSDIDCLVIYERSNRAMALKNVSDLVKFASLKFVPFAPILIQSDFAEEGLHTISNLLRLHLFGAAARDDTVINIDPTEFIKSHACSPYEEAMEYLAHKLDKLQKDFVEMPAMDPKQKARALQKSIEAPHHVVRKVVQSMIAKKERGEEKPILSAMYRLVDTHEHMRKAFASFIELDNAYTDELDRQLMGHRSAHRYDEAVRNIERAMPRVIQFIIDNVDFLKHNRARCI